MGFPVSCGFPSFSIGLPYYFSNNSPLKKEDPLAFSYCHWLLQLRCCTRQCLSDQLVNVHGPMRLPKNVPWTPLVGPWHHLIHFFFEVALQMRGLDHVGDAPKHRAKAILPKLVEGPAQAEDGPGPNHGDHKPG